MQALKQSEVWSKSVTALVWRTRLNARLDGLRTWQAYGTFERTPAAVARLLG